MEESLERPGRPSRPLEDPSPEQDIDKQLKEPSKELQEGSVSSSTATRGDKEDEQHSIYPKDLKEDKSCKETAVIRTSRTRGREAEGSGDSSGSREGPGGGGKPRP